MDQPARAAQTIAKLLQSFTTKSNLKLRYQVKLRGPKTSEAAPGSAQEDAQELLVVFTGPDTPILTARNGELLNALEHVAGKMLRLEPEEHHRISFDADNFKSNRDRELRHEAETAIERVNTTGRPYSFPPMSSRERRMLHLLLAEAGMTTASSGEGPGRFVVVYPHGAAAEAEPIGQPRRPDPDQVRRAFRHR